MRPIVEAIGRVSGKTFSRKYIALGRVITHWPEIAGPDLAARAQPVGIKYAGKERGKAPAAALEIAATAADATMLHYQKDLILERINQIFGEGWITSLRFVALAANAPSPRAPKRKKPLTENEKTLLNDMLKVVEDAPLRETLDGLGQAIYQENATERSS